MLEFPPADLSFVAHQSGDCSCFKGFTHKFWNVTPAHFLAPGRSLRQSSCTAAQKEPSFVILWRSESPLFKFLPLLEWSHKTPADRHCDRFRNTVATVTLYSLIHLMNFSLFSSAQMFGAKGDMFPLFFMTSNTHLDNMDSPAQDTHTHTPRGKPVVRGCV